MNALAIKEVWSWHYPPSADELHFVTQGMQTKYPGPYRIVAEYDTKQELYVPRFEFYCTPEQKTFWLLKYT